MKKCTLCLTEKPLDEFYKNKRSPDGHASRCKVCNRKYCDEWNKNNPEKVRAIWQRVEKKNTLTGRVKARRYGLTQEQYEQLVLQANGKCGICKQKKTLHIDHDHATGKVRGLLCLQCNTALGNFSNSIVLLTNATEYLRAVSTVG